VLGTAAEHFTRNVPVVAPAARAEEVHRLLASARFESVRDIAVCEGERLAGLVRIEDVLCAAPGTPVSEIMDAQPPFVGPGVDQEVAAWAMVRHGESSLALVDERGRFAGLIPPHRMLEVLLREHEEDLARLSGFLHDTRAARLASEEPVWQRLRHRLPWLLVGLVGALASSLLVSRFEGALARTIELAYFLPAIVYLADAVGTQTEALIVRGLSIGVPIGRIVRRELWTGGLVGAVLAGIFLPFALGFWAQPGLAATVAVAVLAACGTATLAGMGLPWLLSRLGQDPAFGSGPLATVLQDLLSIGIYFGVAALIL
jgi:magnesium transporter